MGFQLYTNRQKSNTGRKVLLLMLFLGLAITAFYHLNKQIQEFYVERELMSVVAQVVIPEIEIPDEQKYNLEYYDIQSGDTLADIFSYLGISDLETLNIVQKAKDIYNLNLVKEGDTLIFAFDKNDLTWQKLIYELNSEEIFVIVKKEDDYDIYIQPIEYRSFSKIATGEIETSLYQSAVIEQGLSPKLIVDLAEVFAWDIDFSTDIRVGDSFKVYYEEKHRRDREAIITGNIFAAKFVNDNNEYLAFYFKSPEDENGHYYDYDGNILEKEFLRSPVQFRYISSGYSNNRYHPILKRYLPHKSIDYVAPLGTPVVSIGSGRVVYVGYDGGWGNTVKVKHGDTYMTQYSHLGNYGSGIKVGQAVAQGQIVGYIGMTGYTTGPHLDFTFYKHGEAVNLFKVELPSGKPLAEEYLPVFKLKRDEYIKQIEG